MTITVIIQSIQNELNYTLVKLIQRQFKKSCLARETNRQHKNFSLIQYPILTMCKAMIRKKPEWRNKTSSRARLRNGSHLPQPTGGWEDKREQQAPQYEARDTCWESERQINENNNDICTWRVKESSEERSIAKGLLQPKWPGMKQGRMWRRKQCPCQEQEE